MLTWSRLLLAPGLVLCRASAVAGSGQGSSLRPSTSAGYLVAEDGASDRVGLIQLNARAQTAAQAGAQQDPAPGPPPSPGYLVAHGSGSELEALATEWTQPPGFHREEWWVVNRTNGHRVYFLQHIPKTAGESFANAALQVIPEQEGLYSDERCWNGPRPIQTGDVRIAFVREPISHVYSLFLEDKYDIFGKLPDPFPENITVWLRSFEGGSVFRPHRNWYSVHNLQTLKLSCSTGNDEVPDLAQAYANLDSLFFLGITEHYQASFCLFFAKTHVLQPLPHFCDCTDQAAWQSFVGTHETHGVPPHSLSDLTEEDVRMIEELTKLDAQLYASALRRFRYEAAEVEHRTGTKILCEG